MESEENLEQKDFYKPKGKQTIKKNAKVPNNVTLLQFMNS
jgi:hypothetical protein